MNEKIKTILFGSPDRTMTAISLVVGVLSFAFTALWTYYPEIPTILLVRDLLVILLLVLFISTLSIKYYKKDELVKLTKRNLLQQIKANHDIVHKFRNHCFADLRNNVVEKGLSELDLEEICAKYFKRVSHSMLTDVRSMFVQYFKARGFDVVDDLTVTLKMIIRSEEAQEILNATEGKNADNLNSGKKFVVTAFRDPITWEKRPERKEVKQLIFHINEENTAFDKVVNKMEDYYLCNDLNEEKGKYRNQSANWQSLYNSVLVAPIRCKQGKDRKTTTFYGLLCVDSLNPEKHNLFDPETTVHMVAQAADTLAVMFMNIEMLKQIKKHNGN